jgi:hypothetical protein
LGGEVAGTPYYSWAVDAYDEKMVKVEVPQLSKGRYAHAAATVGDYVLVGGGSREGESFSNNVEAYVYS